MGSAVFGRRELPALRAIPISLAFVFIFFSHWAWGETAREVGWRVDNFGQAVRLLVVPMLLAAMLLVILGWLLANRQFDAPHSDRSIGWLIRTGFMWGLIQQYVLQGFINRRAQAVWGRGLRSVLLVALIFALFHLPNFWAMVATFIGGVVWAAVYQRVPNLFALGLSQSIMTSVLVSTVPHSVLHHMRVGFNYFR